MLIKKLSPPLESIYILFMNSLKNMMKLKYYKWMGWKWNKYFIFSLICFKSKIMTKKKRYIFFIILLFHFYFSFHSIRIKINIELVFYHSMFFFSPSKKKNLKSKGEYEGFLKNLFNIITCLLSNKLLPCLGWRVERYKRGNLNFLLFLCNMGGERIWKKIWKSQIIFYFNNSIIIMQDRKFEP